MVVVSSGEVKKHNRKSAFFSMTVLIQVCSSSHGQTVKSLITSGEVERKVGADVAGLSVFGPLVGATGAEVVGATGAGVEGTTGAGVGETGGCVGETGG